MIADSIHSTVYRDPARYAGWPANYGMWAWKDEIVLGFTVGWPDRDGGFHSRDRSRPFEAMQARSLDGGETWKVSRSPLAGGLGLGAYEHQDANVVATLRLPQFQHLPKTDFCHEDFVVLCGRTGLRHGASSWFYTSADRSRSWNGPFKLPMFGQRGIAARTDWLIHGSDSATVMLTATKVNGEEGRVFAARTDDGGQTFRFLSWIDESPPGFEIMPSSVMLDDRTMLTAVRGRGLTQRENWIDLYRSDDSAMTWTRLGRPVDDTGDGGNPPSMLRLHDGRLAITYGLRKPPFGIYAIVSDDLGATWSDAIEIRKTTGNHDIGYTRSAQRADGKLVTGYYINDNADGERYIAVSICRL